jgi:hypothetical protein
VLFNDSKISRTILIESETAYQKALNERGNKQKIESFISITRDRLSIKKDILLN